MRRKMTYGFLSFSFARMYTFSFRCGSCLCVCARVFIYEITFHLFFLLAAPLSHICCARARKRRERAARSVYVNISQPPALTRVHILLLLEINTCVLVTQLDHFARARIKISFAPPIAYHTCLLTHKIFDWRKIRTVCVGEFFFMTFPRSSCNPFSGFVLMLIMFYVFLRDFDSWGKEISPFRICGVIREARMKTKTRRKFDVRDEFMFSCVPLVAMRFSVLWEIWWTISVQISLSRFALFSRILLMMITCLMYDLAVCGHGSWESSAVASRES